MTYIHHVSIINRDAKQSFHFYRHILGLKLLMKTVNQDDNTMYHLFFGDKTGRPGTEVTLFEIQDGRNKKFGTNAIERMLFKVPSEDSLHFWASRFDDMGVCHYGIENHNNRKTLRFEGPDDTALGLAVIHQEEDIKQFAPAAADDIPQEHRILAIDSIHFRTRYPEATAKEIARYHGFDTSTKTHFFDTDIEVTVMKNNELFTHELHIIHDTHAPDEETGIGSIHHVALSINTLDALNRLHHALGERHFTQSPIKDREFFKSLYYRDPNNLLIEVAAPGIFHAQPNAGAENFEDIPLLLPEFLEQKRAGIEQNLSY